MINPDYLKTFMALIETNSFTKTAEKLHMTQPGVSQHVRKLEEHFQTDLIFRVGKSFTITEAGKRLIEYSGVLFSDHEKLKTQIGKDDPFSGTCTYSSPGSFGLKLFDALIDATKKHPALSLSLSVAPNSSIPQMLLNRQIDVGFMTKEPNDPGLVSKKYGEEELLLIVPAKMQIKKFSDLVNLGFVNHPDGAYLAERLLVPNFSSNLDTIPNRIFINQINRILDPVAEGLGFTVLPEGVYRKYANPKKHAIVKLKIKVSDEIYRVQRSNEILPKRYQTTEKFLK